MKKFSYVTILLVVFIFLLASSEQAFCGAEAVVWGKDTVWTYAFTNTGVMAKGSCIHDTSNAGDSSSSTCATVSGSEFGHAYAFAGANWNLRLRLGASASGFAGPAVLMAADSVYDTLNIQGSLNAARDTLTLIVKAILATPDTTSKWVSYLSAKVDTVEGTIAGDTLMFLNALPAPLRSGTVQLQGATLNVTGNFFNAGKFVKTAVGTGKTATIIDTLRIFLSTSPDSSRIVVFGTSEILGKNVVPFLGGWGILALAVILVGTAWYALKRRRVKPVGVST